MNNDKQKYINYNTISNTKNFNNTNSNNFIQFNIDSNNVKDNVKFNDSKLTVFGSGRRN